MKPLKNHLKWMIAFITLITLLLWTLFFYTILKYALPLDFSQDYRNIPGSEKIVFGTNWENQCYKRCFWGLKKIENPQIDLIDKAVFGKSDDSIFEVSNLIDTNNEIHQSIYSSDKKYILYCEIDYNYMGSDMTDDEYCYYRVYEIETDTVVTIYQGYREWYSLLWID